MSVFALLHDQQPWLLHRFSTKRAASATNALNINNEDMSRQILFHAMFGTYVEDFGILQFMTGHQHWLKRSDMSSAFATMKASAAGMDSAKKFKPLPLLYYSKLASATLLKDAATTTQATNACPIFAGYRIRKFTNEMAAAMRADEGRVASIQTVNAACAHLCLLHLPPQDDRGKGL